MTLEGYTFKKNSFYKVNPNNNGSRLKCILSAFCHSNDIVLRITDDDGEYSDSKSIYSAFGRLIRENDFPCKVSMRKGQVYLIKLD